jgi:hypothetical protein
MNAVTRLVGFDDLTLGSFIAVPRLIERHDRARPVLRDREDQADDQRTIFFGGWRKSYRGTRGA